MYQTSREETEMRNTDIRNRDIKIKIAKSDEDANSAILRYMKRHGYRINCWIDGKDLPHQYFFNGTYEVWVSLMISCGNSVTFTLSGNRIG